MAEVTIQAENVARSFGRGDLRSYALRDVSLTLHAGEITVLLGPSGSGKSTLLAILSGLMQPDAGRVLSLGQDLWALTNNQREVFRRNHCGFIFQGYNLFPALNAMQQLEIVLEWGQRMSKREARALATATLGELGLKEKCRLRPQELSGGEKQRVAVARALVKKPALLFADEPTAALDWKHGQTVVRLLRETAHQNQTTVLLVTHDPRIVPLADQVIHLDDGQITESTAGLEVAHA